MFKLGINIDHIASIRNLRKYKNTDLLLISLIIKKLNINFLTLHLREDRRHINDLDIIKIKSLIKIPINLEISNNINIINFSCKIKPDFICLVPEKRKELTTESGLNLIDKNILNKLSKSIKKINKFKIFISIFIDPKIKQIEKSVLLNINIIELHTGYYSNNFSKKQFKKSLIYIKFAVYYSINLKFKINAGHGLNFYNIKNILKIKKISDISIGYSIIITSIFTGIYNSILKIKKLLN